MECSSSTTQKRRLKMFKDHLLITIKTMTLKMITAMNNNEGDNDDTDHLSPLVLLSCLSLFLFLMASVLVLPSSRSRPTPNTAIREARQCSISASSRPMAAGYWLCLSPL